MAPSKKAKRLVLLDTHAILHRAYHAIPDFSTSKGEPTGALFGLVSMILSIVETLKPDYIVAAFDLPKPTHRHEVYKEYKAGRAKTDSELISQIIKSRVVLDTLAIPLYDKEGFEADDILGTIVDKTKDNKDIEIVIASGDMDTLQLVSGKKVQVYTMKKGIKDVVLYDEDAVNTRFGFGPKLLPDYKGLRGDPSDNIIGIKGIGEKTATTLITEFGSVEEIYKKLKKDEKSFLAKKITPRIIELLKNGEEEAEFSKVLATIRPDAPIDFEIPEKTWSESVDITKTTALFSELEFRTMGERLKRAIGITSTESKEVETKAEEAIESIVPDADFKEVSVALWVVSSNLTNPTIEDVYTFAKTRDFAEAKKIIFAELEKRNQQKVFDDIEKPLIPILDEMKECGIKIDAKYLKQLGTDYHKTLVGIEKEIWKYAGKEFNVASPKQLGEVLFTDLGLQGPRQKKTAGGALSTKESELEKLIDVHPIIAEVLKYREFAKLLGTYIDPMPELLDKNSRIHPTFIQTGAATGRMATENPSVQNIPNRSELGRKIRNAFTVEKDWKLVALDYSQIELRIAAFLSKDEKFIDIFRRGEDVHSAVASQVFGVSVDAVTKEMRSQAKVINFGVMYGMGVTALQKNLGTDRKAAQKFYNDYFEKFHGLAGYLDSVKADAAKTGFTETYFGRRRYFEGFKSKLPFIRASAERMAINAPIQGTEADIVKLAMIRIDEFIQKKKLSQDIHMLMQVHDEIVFEMKEGVAEKVLKDIKEIMENIIPPKDIHGIVCTAEAKIGDNWGEMEKLG